MLKMRSVQLKNTWRITWRFEDLTWMWWCLCKIFMIWVRGNVITIRRVMKLTKNERKLDDQPLNLEFEWEDLREKWCLILGGNEGNEWSEEWERGFPNSFGRELLGNEWGSTMRWLGVVGSTIAGQRNGHGVVVCVKYYGKIHTPPHDLT